MKQSCIHIYCGDGKGKSTAVTGLAVRAAGSGRRVIFTQFMKDGKSSELKVLRELPGVTVLTCEKQFGFFWNMTDEQKKEAAAAYQALFDRATELAVREDAFLLVMDEFMSSRHAGSGKSPGFSEEPSERPGGGPDRPGSGPGASGTGRLCLRGAENQASLRPGCTCPEGN